MDIARHFTTRTAAAIILTIALLAGTAVSAPPADAAAACAGKSQNAIKHLYRTKAGLQVPVRCGFNYWTGRRQSGFGVKHLQAHRRYNPWYRGMIGATLQNPQIAWTKGSTRIYVTQWFRNCRPVYRFRVVVQLEHKGGTKLMRGVITAYREIRS